jgi:hypothetical protein
LTARAQIFEALGRKEEAIAGFKKALALNASIEDASAGLKRLDPAGLAAPPTPPSEDHIARSRNCAKFLPLIGKDHLGAVRLAPALPHRVELSPPVQKNMIPEWPKDFLGSWVTFPHHGPQSLRRLLASSAAPSQADVQSLAVGIRLGPGAEMMPRRQRWMLNGEGLAQNGTHELSLYSSH